MKILLIDDHHLIGKSLEISLNKYDEIEAFMFLPKPEKFSETIEFFRPNIVLMDIHMGEYNGLDLGQIIIEKYKIKLAFLSGFNLMEYRKKAIEIGAFAFLDKSIDVDKLVYQLNKIHKSNNPCFEENSYMDQNSKLTTREKEILQLCSQGIKQTAIASELQISERTVRNHVYSINQKLQTNTIIESIIKSIEMGIVSIKL